MLTVFVTLNVILSKMLCRCRTTGFPYFFVGFISNCAWLWWYTNRSIAYVFATYCASFNASIFLPINGKTTGTFNIFECFQSPIIALCQLEKYLTCIQVATLTKQGIHKIDLYVHWSTIFRNIVSISAAYSNNNHAVRKISVLQYCYQNCSFTLCRRWNSSRDVFSHAIAIKISLKISQCLMEETVSTR